MPQAINYKQEDVALSGKSRDNERYSKLGENIIMRLQIENLKENAYIWI